METVHINEMANLKIGKFFKRAFGGIVKNPLVALPIITTTIPGAGSVLTNVLGRAGPWVLTLGKSNLGLVPWKTQQDPLNILATLQAQQAMEQWRKYGKKLESRGETIIRTATNMLPTINKYQQIIEQQIIPTYMAMGGYDNIPMSQALANLSNFLFGPSNWQMPPF